MFWWHPLEFRDPDIGKVQTLVKRRTVPSPGSHQNTFRAPDTPELASWLLTRIVIEHIKCAFCAVVPAARHIASQELHNLNNVKVQLRGRFVAV
jgi:hypothetical protein